MLGGGHGAAQRISYGRRAGRTAASTALSDDRLASYKGSVPAAWCSAGTAVDDAISLIRGVRDHIDDALAEVRRVLS